MRRTRRNAYDARRAGSLREAAAAADRWSRAIDRLKAESVATTLADDGNPLTAVTRDPPEFAGPESAGAKWAVAADDVGPEAAARLSQPLAASPTVSNGPGRPRPASAEWDLAVRAIDMDRPALLRDERPSQPINSRTSTRAVPLGPDSEPRVQAVDLKGSLLLQDDASSQSAGDSTDGEISGSDSKSAAQVVDQKLPYDLGDDQASKWAGGGLTDNEVPGSDGKAAARFLDPTVSSVSQEGAASGLAAIGELSGPDWDACAQAVDPNSSAMPRDDGSSRWAGTYARASIGLSGNWNTSHQVFDPDGSLVLQNDGSNQPAGAAGFIDDAFYGSQASIPQSPASGPASSDQQDLIEQVRQQLQVIRQTLEKVLAKPGSVVLD